MSILNGNQANFARRNLWDATLSNHLGNFLSWTTGYIKAVSSPRLSFSLSDININSTKVYTEWKLPDSISLTIWETSGHMVEELLNNWMTGANGVFDISQGAFRTTTNPNNLYRKLRIRTLYYSHDNAQSTNYDIHKKEYKGEYDQSFITKQNRDVHQLPLIQKKQVIPVLDKFTELTTAVSKKVIREVENQVGGVPSDITSRLTSLMVFPPLLMKQTIPTSLINATVYPDTITKMYNRESEVSASVNLTTNGANNAKNWSPREVISSTTIYTVGIEGYDVGTYDYSSGEGVAYEVKLAVCDIQTNTNSQLNTNNEEWTGSR